MIYLVSRMKLSEKARRDMTGFWSWIEARERWFYRDLPMVKGVRWYLTAVGELYTLECWSAFEDEFGYAAYRKAMSGLKSDAGWEAQRVSQDDWWHFLDSRLMSDLPCRLGFGTVGATAD